MSSPVTPNAFAHHVMGRALSDMKERLAQIEPLIAEADGLKKAIAEQEKAIRRLPTVASGSAAAPALPAPAAAPRPSTPMGTAPGRRPPADGELGTVKQQLYRLLGREDARRGVAAAVLARAVKGAQTNSVLAQLSTLSRDENEGIEQVGRGFYKLAAGWSVDERGVAHPPAA